MSQQWHEHLNNLTWWEQIDRFFNPNKYSCTGMFVSDDVYHWILGAIIALTMISIAILLLMRRWKNES